jgi:hypothetical protein
MTFNLTPLRNKVIDSHFIEIIIRGRIYHETGIVDGSSVVDEPKALTPMVKIQVILMIHKLEGDDVACRAILLRDNGWPCRLPQSAKKLDYQ